ncbi:MAG: ABC transporter permease [Ardenticatenaceae bacterium]|nr:ABC transporter permease [Ardenticatenaceae bacterium]
MAQATDKLTRRPVLSRFPRLHVRLQATTGRSLLPVLLLLLLVILWEVIVKVRGISVIILPAPSVVFQRLLEEPGYFFIENGLITLYEAVAGFALGAAVAIALASVMVHSSLVERTAFPLAVLVKATPIVVIAPLLVIWFGYGPMPKIIMASLICFFPILVNTIVGLRSVDATSLEFFHSLAASKWEIFRQLRIPHSLPYVLASFKTAASLSVIGAVVAEWAGAGRGLGRVVFIKAANLDQAAVFAGVFVLAAMGILLTAIVGWLEKRLLYWHESVLVG